MLTSPASKAELRNSALARRAELDPDGRADASRRATGHLRPLLRPGEIVSLFWPMRDEIDPRGLIDHVHALGGRIAMPVIEKRRMFFRAFDGEDSLEAGVFGTSHPHAGQPGLDPDFVVDRHHRDERALWLNCTTN